MTDYTDPVARAEEAEPDIEMHVLSDEELAELDAEDGPEATDQIDLDDDEIDAGFVGGDDDDEEDDGVVNSENFESFLPEYNEDNPPGINLLAFKNAGELLNDDGTLSAQAQREYDEPPPKPQSSYEGHEGI